MYSHQRANNYFLYAMVYFLAGSIVLNLVLDTLDLQLSISALIALTQIGFVFLPVVVYILVTRSPIKESLLLNKLSFASAGLSVLIGFCILPFLSLLNVLSQFFVTNYIGTALTETLELPFLLNLLLIGVFPSVFEELSTRSLIIRNYQDRNVYLTCIISGLFFGILHMNINQFIYAFVMGVVMAFVVMITGSVYSSMLIHFTINGSMITLQTIVYKVLTQLGDIDALEAAFSNTAGPSTQELLMSAIVMGILSILFLPLVALLLYALVAHNKKRHLLNKHTKTHELLISRPVEVPLYEFPIESIQKKESIVTPSFAFIIVLFIAYVFIFEILMF